MSLSHLHQSRLLKLLRPRVALSANLHLSRLLTTAPIGLQPSYQNLGLWDVRKFLFYFLEYPVVLLGTT